MRQQTRKPKRWEVFGIEAFHHQTTLAVKPGDLRADDLRAVRHQDATAQPNESPLVQQLLPGTSPTLNTGDNHVHP